MRTTCLDAHDLPRTFQDWARNDHATLQDIVVSVHETTLASLQSKVLYKDLARAGRSIDYLPWDFKDVRSALREVAGLAVARGLSNLQAMLRSDEIEPRPGRAADCLATFTRNVLTQEYRTWFKEETGWGSCWFRFVSWEDVPREAPAARVDDQLLFMDLLWGLPEDSRLCALLYAFGDSQKDIGKRLGFSQSKVSRRLAACRA